MMAWSGGASLNKANKAPIKCLGGIAARDVLKNHFRAFNFIQTPTPDITTSGEFIAR
jgi:hypothetical protein